MRTAEIKRKTKETALELRLTLEGGERRIDTGIGFFDHMLNSFAVHSGFGLELTCKGDLEVDGHHSVEDCGIALGQALSLCLGDKAGIARFGQAFVPMDEALGFCALDISGPAVPRVRCTHAAADVRPVRHLSDGRVHACARGQRRSDASSEERVRRKRAPHHRSAVQGARPVRSNRP